MGTFAGYDTVDRRVIEPLANSEDRIFWACEVEPERVVHVSARFEEIWGFSPDRVYQDPRVWLRSIHPDDQPQVKVAFERWMRGEAPEYCVEYRVVRPDGSERRILARGMIREKANGRVGFAAGIAWDVTDDLNPPQENRGDVIQLQEELDLASVHVRRRAEHGNEPDRIVGRSPALVAALNQVSHVARTEASVLILGETGVGKELFARRLHRLSRRSDRPFVKVNCAALPDSLIESELFGHLKGAFTGALSDRTGRFEMADGGTIFLDEIGELNMDMQAKFLHVLQEGEFERIGSSETVRVDVRVIAATNRDLSSVVSQGLFRADLYYRLAVFPIVVPALHQRREDIPMLVWNCVRRAQNGDQKPVTSIPSDVMRRLVEYDWPGNVRELENVIERSVIMSTEGTLKLDLPNQPGLISASPGGSHGDSRQAAPAAAAKSNAADESLDEVERRHIIDVLEACGWKIKGPGRAAERLGLNPSTLRYRMSRLGIQRPDSRPQ